MLTPAQIAKLHRKLEKYEGRVAYMYLDTTGNVTVGVGQRLATVAAAQKLKFLTRDGDRIASDSQIAEDFKAISKRNTGYVASYYRQFTDLYLPESEIDRLTRKHIRSFHHELKRIYTDFESFPWTAKQALFDMIFNLGATKLRLRWPRMNHAIGAGNWCGAAKESHRLGIQPSRNAYVRTLFQNAAEKDCTR